ncbi:MAG: hypothetical protein OXF93_23525 [Acidobacteria bacterium]|nr:hypothetical protein [Acidobacteriota bacterium]
MQSVWDATVDIAGTPGERYLVERRCVWWPGHERLPAAVRWFPRSKVDIVHGALRPELPEDAAGALVYRFADPAESETAFLQLEAVAEDGARVPFIVKVGGVRQREAKRPSQYGSSGGNRRVFQAAAGNGARVHLTEGPLDAMALVTLARLREIDLKGGAVHGMPGIGTFGPSVCYGARDVTLWPDGDNGAAVAARKADQMEAKLGRPVRIRRRRAGCDLADEAQELVLEREAIRLEGSGG